MLWKPVTLTFIDPYIDLREERYEGFGKLVLEARRQDVLPRIIIHCKIVRVPTDQTRKHWRPQYERECRERFAPLVELLRPSPLIADVFVWDDFHDRYLLTNLIGISVPNGFGIATGGEEEWTTWTRMSRADKENVESEFDPNSHKQEPEFSFRISGMGFSDQIH
jgi:hypothetical protein